MNELTRRLSQEYPHAEPGSNTKSLENVRGGLTVGNTELTGTQQRVNFYNDNRNFKTNILSKNSTKSKQGSDRTVSPAE